MEPLRVGSAMVYICNFSKFDYVALGHTMKIHVLPENGGSPVICDVTSTGVPKQGKWQVTPQTFPVARTYRIQAVSYLNGEAQYRSDPISLVVVENK